ncbi:MAG: FeoA family protein [Syntrophomonadaceae bacterium]|nr:FeoA family protein [Syntrophomonadaceae bacterium]
MKSTAMKPGQKGKVKSISKGSKAERKMFEMGIIPGVEIELLSCYPFKGPLLFNVGQMQIALGRGMAEAVDVEILP